MPISYVKVNWLNQPSTETPISQNNLRHMDDQIYLLTTEKAELTDLPTKVSDLSNDSGFQTASDIAAAISAIGNIQVIKGRVDNYEDLPTSGQSVGDTYFVGLTTDIDMEEYVWTADDTWEKLGKVTAVDLADYYTKGQVDTLLGSKVASTEIKAIKTVSGGIAYTLNGTDWVNVVSGNDGATFIPAVTSLGDLSWTNNKGYPNPSTVNVRGKDLIIKAIYPTVNDLQTIHPVGSIGDVYAVGNSTYNELYIWNVETSAWTNIGSMQNPYVHPNHSGDVVSVGDGATTIGNNKVTNAKLAQVANSTIKGRKSSGTGNVEDLTPADVRTMLNVADGANNYVLPAATTSTIGGVKIKNYLTSTDVDAALTAAQGKVLKDLVDGIDGDLTALEAFKMNMRTDISISTGSWADVPSGDPMYGVTDFVKYADITANGCSTSYYAHVVPTSDDDINNRWVTGTNYIRVYRKTIPASAITIVTAVWQKCEVIT